VRRQPILRDLDALGQARRDHPPPHRTLQRTEREDAPQPTFQVAGQKAAPHEPQERQQIDQTDHPPEQAVAPFPPEDGLELMQRHAGIEFAILRDRLIALERLVPLLLVERRQRSGHRLPFDDGKAGFRKTRRATDQHHQRDQSRQDHEPPAHRANASGRGAGARFRRSQDFGHFSRNFRRI